MGMMVNRSDSGGVTSYDGPEAGGPEAEATGVSLL